MMNYIATQMIAYYVYIEGGGSNVINPVAYGNFPAVGNNDYFVNIVTVAVITVLMFIYLKYSKQGYEISVVGESQNTARYVGINVKKVIIRTLDIGADKQCPYFGMEKEENPALGYRAIRVCLTQPQIFKTQLRALLRASIYGNLSIMYPMITSLEEVRRIKEITEEVKKELTEQGYQIVTLRELFYYKNVELINGTVYHSSYN